MRTWDVQHQWMLSQPPKSDVQWENGGPNWQVSSFSSCDIGSELGESKGLQDPPGTAAQGFAEALSWEQASQGGPRLLSHAKQLRDLEDKHRALGNPTSSLWFFSNLRMETRSSLTREADSLSFVAKQQLFPTFTSTSLSLNSPAHSFLTGESQCMSPKFSGRLGVQQPRVYTVLWKLQGEICISLLHFKSFWTFSISDKSYLW